MNGTDYEVPHCGAFNTNNNIIINNIIINNIIINNIIINIINNNNNNKIIRKKMESSLFAWAHVCL